ncbi:iron complex outermembrane recepter protein [Salinimicrobium sediminis]|uniref:Iron complex outermembrane recepter protein n=1 Tax=Salinimicrobium sediminis TaxID=1343891 RepID=A0A285X4E3_9FLAO|nr:TonB-dependent receptor [Salinimicrobium sediminis]SOC80217.1 iron complex outermembrane recepter protein [Salinimicrobium sediminis]
MKNIIFGLLLLAAGNIYSQNSIKGTVVNDENNQPVIGATVQVIKPERNTITDLTGKFIIENLSDGSYDLVISSLGFGTRTIKIEIPLDQDLVINLSPTAIEMEEVIISTPFHQLQSENVMKVERVTMEGLQRTGGNRITDGITQIAGVETVTTGSSIGKPVIRGLSSNRVLVYAQGVRLENQQFGDEHGLGLSSSGIESVEVIKGPASLLYGSDALGGVLYLNPERFAPADSTVVDGETSYYSNTEGFEANAGVKTSGDKLKFIFRGNFASHVDYETGDGERVTNTRFTEYDFKTGLGFRNNSYKGDLRYNLNSNTSGIPEEIGLQSTSRTKLEPYQQVANHILSFDNSFYFEESSLDVKLGYLFNNRKEFEEAHHEEETGEEHEEHENEEEGPALEMHLSTLNYDVKYHFPDRGKFETIIGLQGMFQSNKNLAEEILIPDATTTDVGILGTTHYHLEKVDFQAGLRYDFRRISAEAYENHEAETEVAALDRNFNSYNGALGVKVDLTSRFTGRLNLASGFRAPNLAELTSYGSHHGTNRFEIGNSALDNEQNYQLDLALEFRNEHFEIFTNAFYNTIKNYIFLDPTGEFMNEDPVFEYQQNDAELYGGEAGIHIHPHPLDWLHFESNYELVIGKQENGEYLPLIPAQSVLNTFWVELPENDIFKEGYASLSLKSVFEQNRTGYFESETSGYSLLNAGLGTSVILDRALLDFRITGTNLLNKTYISHLSRLKPEGIPNMGRNIILSAGIRF